MERSLLSQYVDNIRIVKNNRLNITFIVAQDVFVPVVEELEIVMCPNGIKSLEKFVGMLVKDNRKLMEELLHAIKNACRV